MQHIYNIPVVDAALNRSVVTDFSALMNVTSGKRKQKKKEFQMKSVNIWRWIIAAISGSQASTLSGDSPASILELKYQSDYQEAYSSTSVLFGLIKPRSLQAFFSVFVTFASQLEWPTWINYINFPYYY